MLTFVHISPNNLTGFTSYTPAPTRNWPINLNNPSPVATYPSHLEHILTSTYKMKLAVIVFTLCLKINTIEPKESPDISYMNISPNVMFLLIYMIACATLIILTLIILIYLSRNIGDQPRFGRRELSFLLEYMKVQYLKRLIFKLLFRIQKHFFRFPFVRWAYIQILSHVSFER